MNLSQYEALIKAVETGTMTQAAEELGYTQSGLTRALSSLEEQWNVRLLNRGRSGVQLTTEGQLLLPYIRTVLHDQRRLSEYIDELNGLREGLIRIGTFNSVSAQWLPGIIKRFHKDYPRIRFELLHGTDEQINSWIADGRVDVGFVAYPSKNEGVEDEITAILNQNRIQPDARFVESDDHAVIAMVEQGLGISLMSMMMLQGFDRHIAAVPLDPPGHRDLGIACRDRRLLSVAASRFYDYACDWVAEYKL